MKTLLKDISVEKSCGRFYSPQYIVENVLDMSGYYGDGILKKHAIDNSCGDGAFLKEMVARYCDSAIAAGLSADETARQLGMCIHGIEIDGEECAKCVENLNTTAARFGIFGVEWDILCADAMTVNKYDGQMDYVLGNPPYIRVHNAGETIEKIKQFSFAKNGMTDQFIVFYEIGLKMLNGRGVLGYITPSSYFNSIAGGAMRKYLVQNNLIEKVIDLKHFQAFEATTYTAITILKKNKTGDAVQYYGYDEKNKIPYYIDSLVSDEYYMGDNFYFADKRNIALLKKILAARDDSGVSVKNGYATLCDSVFIGNFPFNSEYIISVIKASTGKRARIIYPYNKNAGLVPEEELRKDANLYKYLTEHKDVLLKRSNEKNPERYWYAFGRSQAINDTYRDKLTINTLIRSLDDSKLVHAPAGVGVYGGLYIMGNGADMQTIKNALVSGEFIAYISLLGKYKSGGYYTFSSKDIKAYLDYKLADNGGN